MAAEDLELKRAFFGESVEILERAEGDLARLGANPRDMEALNAVFRSLHTIKGNSSFLSLEKITRLSHLAETLLDRARRKEIPVSKTLLTLVGQVLAELAIMIGEQETDRDVGALSRALERFQAGDSAAAEALAAKATPAVAATGSAPAQKIATTSFVRVEEAKVSKIIGLAGEIELMRHAFEKLPEKMDLLGPEAADLRFEVDLQVSKLSRLSRSLGSLVFGVRLVPVNQVFQRFPRVVAELAAKLGKEIRLKVENGDAELDKAIVEAITEPMTHLIRNSADHGIEPAAERRQRGKTGAGTIRLNSYVRGNFVYIEIADDGRGIDGAKVLAKAIEKGIVPADKADSLTESQRLALIFAPGFSTAEKVTDISGRGVGMDVVKSNINRLKGTVIIESEPGRGTTIQLRFPMSMVVMFTLVAEVNGICCTIPVDQVQESMDYPVGELLEQVPAGADPADYLALHSMRSLLWGASDDKVPSAFHTLVFKEARGLAFIVDEFVSIEEAIVQSVDSYIAALPGVQGATVRKDGSVALVINAQSVLEHARRSKPYAYVKRREQVVSDSASNLADFLEISGS